MYRIRFEPKFFFLNPGSKNHLFSFQKAVDMIISK